jgi:hypothetical protein
LNRLSRRTEILIGFNSMNTTRRHPWWIFVAVLIALVGTTRVASAQRVVVVEGGPEYDGPRFRGGVSIGGGGFFANGYGVGTAQVDGRLGVQINNLIGVYAQPYLGGGGGSVGGGVSGGFGTFGVDAVIDFTLADRFFLGAGGGAGVVVIPTGPNTDGGAGAAEQLLFRVGFYPIVWRRGRRARRGGLMLGADIRPFFISGTALVQATANIGIEAF